MLAWKIKGTELYQELPSECFASLKPCEPLRRQPAFKQQQQQDYSVWKKHKKQKE